MAEALKTLVTLFSADMTTDGTAVTDTNRTGRRLLQMIPPYVLNCSLADAGATTPGGTNYSVQAIVQDSDTLTGTYATAFSGTAITTQTGNDRTTHAGQLRPYVRVVITSVVGTWNAGTTITATLTGEGIA